MSVFQFGLCLFNASAAIVFLAEKRTLTRLMNACGWLAAMTCQIQLQAAWHYI